MIITELLLDYLRTEQNALTIYLQRQHPPEISENISNTNIVLDTYFCTYSYVLTIAYDTIHSLASESARFMPTSPLSLVMANFIELELSP